MSYSYSSRNDYRSSGARWSNDYRSQSREERHRDHNRYSSFPNNASGRIQELTLRKEYFSMIKNGLKTIEGRVNTRMFSGMAQGDRITFICGPSRLPCLVKGNRTYASFREMLEQEGVQKCLPNAASLDEAVAVYHRIPGYQDKAHRFGVAAIEIEVINSGQARSSQSASEPRRSPDRSRNQPSTASTDSIKKRKREETASDNDTAPAKKNKLENTVATRRNPR